tara:strand:- start:29910 stop:31049 length:1140 start_codon:yes stop_codon:yes gene_type:complete
VPGPLEGIRVIEISAIGPAPFAGMYLSDLGAEVIRIGRVAQNRNPLASNSGPLERGKKSINLDLKSQEGVEIALGLIENGDVLIEGFRPGVAEKLGLGPAECLLRNPKLVYGRMTGWGQEGPLSRSAGHDINYIGLAGPLAHIGRNGQPPSVPLNLVGDFGGGSLFLIAGILAALVAVSNGSDGQIIDAAMVDGAAYLASPLFSAYQSGFWSNQRGTNLLDSGAPFYDVYECKCGDFLATGAIEPQFYKQLLKGLGFDPDEIPPQNDRAYWQETKEKFTARFLTKRRSEWLKIFDGTDACVSPVLNMGESYLHQHATDRDAFFETCGVIQPKPAPRFSLTKTEPSQESESLGQSTSEILLSIGRSTDQINDYFDRGIVS